VDIYLISERPSCPSTTICPSKVAVAWRSFAEAEGCGELEWDALPQAGNRAWNSSCCNRCGDGRSEETGGITRGSLRNETHLLQEVHLFCKVLGFEGPFDCFLFCVFWRGMASKAGKLLVLGMVGLVMLGSFVNVGTYLVPDKVHEVSRYGEKKEIEDSDSKE